MKENKKFCSSVAVATINLKQLKPKWFLLRPHTDDIKEREEQTNSEPNIQNCGYLEAGKAEGLPVLTGVTDVVCRTFSLLELCHREITLIKYYFSSRSFFLIVGTHCQWRCLVCFDRPQGVTLVSEIMTVSFALVKDSKAAILSIRVDLTLK